MNKMKGNKNASKTGILFFKARKQQKAKTTAS